jgi:hypothetical protein
MTKLYYVTLTIAAAIKEFFCPTPQRARVLVRRNNNKSPFQ